MSVKFTVHPLAHSDIPGDPLYAILPSDGTNGYMVGTIREIKALTTALVRLIEHGKHSDEIDELDERLGWTWVSVPRAVALAQEKGCTIAAVSVRRAAREGRIPGARRDGPDWRMPQARFLAWLARADAHKAGRKPSRSK